jgi:putative ABC transport system permease protein
VALAVAVLPATVNSAWTDMRGAFTHSAYDARQYVRAELQVEEGSRVSGNAIAEIVRRLEESPAITDVAYRTSFAKRRGPIEAEKVASPPGALGFRSGSYAVSPDYFELYGLRLLGGRGFIPGDMDTAATAVIVNQAFATKVFGTASPLGRRIRYAAVPAASDLTPAREASRWYEIVGVVSNERVNDVAPDLIVPGLYYAVSPETMASGETMVLEARTRETGLASVVPVMRRVVSQVDPTIRVGQVVQLANANRQDLIIAKLLGLALGLILLSVFLLSAAGIYTLVSFTITRRRKEIGIRSALGATQRQVIGAVLGPVAKQVFAGMVIGIGGSAVMDRVMGGELFGGRAGVLLPMFGIMMAIVALAAAFGPARRGIRVAPTEALRSET